MQHKTTSAPEILDYEHKLWNEGADGPKPRENELAQQSVPCGKYTITSPSGAHRSFWIKQIPKGALRGHRTANLLVGPDNQNDWRGFAFVDDKGIHVWKRLDTHHYRQLANLLFTMIKFDKECGFGRQGFTIQRSLHCSRCNRELTDPISIKLGIGPECRKHKELHA